ncbi:ABC transporter substrate-binding protein [Bermanella marisrubri]|uniref:ABC-type nitrate/sulfonate/bicarbonate transport systems periplasmic components-like protein n=1 Tax=Bermanella marisrubri TaxID=207949 RepID=Q1MXM0_9GAMM|nr:ABC transporter substrate-binding protein [Bermanella marisrubri]EAT10713.1 ABC-type nitrate/sulfonate/bicarbonate transport systems periplasmic components-like protein [Oceanobacter sp. RED65] [Bermanella marisrubri]QIZ83875.1 ABC transporter substrate-binding protein [Bermanella marisrubri]
MASYLFKLVVGLVFIPLLLACTSYKDPIKVGNNIWPGFALYYLAQSKGLINTEHVRLVEYQNATYVSEALISGDLDAAMLTLDEVLRLQELGINLTIIQVIDVSRGADVVMSRIPLTELNDFSGKTIAVERSAVGALVMAAFQDFFDIPDNALKIIDSTVERSVQAYEQGADFIVTNAPFSQYVAKNGAYQVFDTSMRPNLVVDVLVVKDEVLAETNEDVFVELVNGFFQAYELLKSQPDVALPYLTKRLRLTDQEVLACYEGLDVANLPQNRGMLSGSKAGLHYILKEVHSILLSASYLERELPINRLFTDEFLPQRL